jgi:competence protein ComEA
MKPWQHILLGVLLGLVLAAMITLVIQSPNGAGLELQPAPTQGAILVHVAGAVGNPGVYELQQNSRVLDAIHEAGGFTQDADRDQLNLAGIVQDGTMIVVPVYDAVLIHDNNSSYMDPSDNTLVNINTAGLNEIDMLPEIGLKKAAEIIAYRDENGPFSTIEDIMDVPGIGPVIFDNIKQFIAVE